MGYSDPTAVWEGPSGVKVDPNDSTFAAEPLSVTLYYPHAGAIPEDLPAIYLFSNARSGDGVAYAMAEDGTVLGSHVCTHWGYMRHDLHDRPDRKETCEAHYPDGYRLVVLTEPGSVPPEEVIERNRQQGEAAKEDG